MITKPNHPSDKTVTWQLRLRQQLKEDKISYRELAFRMKTTDALITKHLTGKAKQESLTFIKRVCAATGYRLDWTLFGELVDGNSDQHPWLSRVGIRQWMEILKNERQNIDAKYINGWFSTPTDLELSDQSFVYQVESSELSSIGLPFGSWVFVDPQKKLTRRESGRSPLKTIGTPLALLLLKKTGGIMVCRMETIADEIWCLPPSGNYPSLLIEDVIVIGKIISGLRAFDECLSFPAHIRQTLY
ncbi:helix-turn-helix domain-containing protein [Bacterioplanoides sp.]|uniref:helix-turn-helix domain-containing protein n=1 Tax=Bacterioplanoides sp. TaxID=2066072 RepID=UPI003B5AE576